LLVLALPSAALGLTTTWNLNGEYSIAFTCTSNCSGVYPHTLDVKFTNLTSGQVTGTGFYDSNPAYTWNLTGILNGTALTLSVDYTGLDPSYMLSLIGAVDTGDGSLSGTASSNSGHTFTWASTAGSARLIPQSLADCSAGSYAGYTLLWEAFVPGYGSPTPTVTTPFNLHSGLDYRIEASGTYFAGGVGLYDIEADAEYSQDQQQRNVGAGWTVAVHNYEGYGEGLLDLLVNGAIINWGAFDNAHRYTTDVAGDSGPLSFAFQVNDFAGYNNTGGLCVAVYATSFDFAGFFQPIDNGLLNVAKAGSSIPVKFSLGGDQGLYVFAAGYPKSVSISCDAAAEGVDVVETYAAGASTLTYDPTIDQYTYVWKTNKVWAGTCRQLKVQLVDGTTHTANFSLR
jgi:hypothetical protein